MYRGFFYHPFFSFLLVLKRFLFAARDVIGPSRLSYAQQGEDIYIQQRLAGFDLTRGIYVDVGANQPTQISNTYLFYRAGGHGIAIEPNPRLEKLYKRFRSRDIHLRIGCSDKPSVLPFVQTTSSVLAKFGNPNQVSISADYLPLLPLDSILENIDYEFIYLLSIDIEGQELEVLQGAEKALKKAIFIVIEDNLGERIIPEYLENLGFVEEIQLGPNVIYVNKMNFHKFVR